MCTDSGIGRPAGAVLTGLAWVSVILWLVHGVPVVIDRSQGATRAREPGPATATHYHEAAE